MLFLSFLPLHILFPPNSVFVLLLILEDFLKCWWSLVIFSYLRDLKSSLIFKKIIDFRETEKGERNIDLLSHLFMRSWEGHVRALNPQSGVAGPCARQLSGRARAWRAHWLEAWLPVWWWEGVLTACGRTQLSGEMQTLYLEWGVGCTGIYTCQNSLYWPLKAFVFHYNPALIKEYNKQFIK